MPSGSPGVRPLGTVGSVAGSGRGGGVSVDELSTLLLAARDGDDEALAEFVRRSEIGRAHV